MGSYGHFPYPLNEKGNPIDTPEWRDTSDITAHSPKSHEKGAADSDLLKCVREYGDKGMEPIEAALAAGADINAADKLGFTALHLAIKSKNTALAAKLLEMEGINLDAKTKKGFAPIHMAAWKGDLNLVQKLITKGCDLKSKDTAGRNVWGVAHDFHHEEILELLKRHDIHYAEGEVLAFLPAPKWRPEHRGKM